MKRTEILRKPVFWLILFLVLIWVAIFQLPDNKLHLIFCNVGQGDAILVSYRATQVLIDGGPNNQVLNCLAENMPFWDRTIEMVVATHPEADHISGLIDVVERYDVRQFVINSFGKETAVFQEFQSVVLAEKSNIYFPKMGDRINLGPLKLSILWPQFQEKILGTTTVDKGTNDASIVLKLSFGNFDVLLTGDISTKIENEIIGGFHTEPVEVLKVAHHGSKYSTGEEFLKQVQPELAVISVGKNSFGHPTEEIIERLSNQAIKLLRTDQEGEIEVVSDGKKWYHSQ